VSKGQKSKNSVVQIVILHRQNPLESTDLFILSAALVAARIDVIGSWDFPFLEPVNKSLIKRVERCTSYFKGGVLAASKPVSRDFAYLIVLDIHLLLMRVCCSKANVHDIKSEVVWQLCWRHGTAFPLCAITASVAVFPSPSGTVVKCLVFTLHRHGVKELFLTNLINKRILHYARTMELILPCI
jgi:hypothetical protein